MSAQAVSKRFITTASQLRLCCSSTVACLFKGDTHTETETEYWAMCAATPTGCCSVPGRTCFMKLNSTLPLSADLPPPLVMADLTSPGHAACKEGQQSHPACAHAQFVLMQPPWCAFPYFQPA